MIRPRFSGRAPYEPLRPWERLSILLFGMLIVGFGVVTLYRSAYLSQRRTDADVYFRAAWAIRTGQDPYAIADTNGWTYLYPPPLAIAVMPLAQAPPDASAHSGQQPHQPLAGWSVSYPVAIVAWYTISIVMLALSVHWMALSLEQYSPHAKVHKPDFRTRRWWVNRVGPLLFCLPAIGSTLARGQVNILLLAGVCGACLLLSRARALSAGVAISTAICLKLFPAFLLLHAALTRSWRIALGCLAGCVVLLGAVPALTLGPARAISITRSFAETMLLPALGQGSNNAKQDELARAFNNQSLLAVLHNWRDWHAATTEHVIRPNGFDQAIFLVIALTLVGLVVAAAAPLAMRGGHRRTSASILLFSTLTALMLILSPVCHNHYFTLHLPLVACLMAAAMDRGRTVDMSPLAWVGLGAYLVASVLPRLPGLDTTLKPAGLQTLACIALVLAGAQLLYRTARQS